MSTQNLKPVPRVVAAALTPCSQKGEVDFPGMRKLAGFLAQRGCDGIFVPSSTGELMMLDDSTRRQLVAEAKDGAGDLEIWSGASGMGFEHVLKLTREAAGEGANGVIIMAPFFMKLSQPELKDYFFRIADASPVPVGMYHHFRFPTAFEPETVGQLMNHPNIVLFKETSGDLDRLKELASVVRGTSFRLYQGSELLMLPSLLEGATGGITALCNPLPELHRAIVDAFLQGDLESAQSAQNTLEKFWKIFRQPEVGQSFSHFVRSIALPLCWRGLFTELSSMNADPHDMEEFDLWLKNYYAENGLNLALPMDGQGIAG